MSLSRHGALTAEYPISQGPIVHTSSDMEFRRSTSMAGNPHSRKLANGVVDLTNGTRMICFPCFAQGLYEYY